MTNKQKAHAALLFADAINHVKWYNECGWIDKRRLYNACLADFVALGNLCDGEANPFEEEPEPDVQEVSAAQIPAIFFGDAGKKNKKGKKQDED